MSSDELLLVEPLELQFPFELKKQIPCSIWLTNKSENYVAFKVKTTNPKKYFVRPNNGIVVPHSTCEVVVTMQAQKEAPPDMQCRDKFLLQSALVRSGSTPKDISAETFNKESGNRVDQCMLTVLYVQPPQPPSPVQEESEEGSSPRDSTSDSGLNFVSKGFAEPEEDMPEANVLISRLKEENQSAMQQNDKLRQELKLLRRQYNARRSGIPFIYIIVIALVGFFLGYLLKRI